MSNTSNRGRVPARFAPPRPAPVLSHLPVLFLAGWRLYDRVLTDYARRGPLRNACTAVMRRFGINRCEVDVNELDWAWSGTGRRCTYRGMDLHDPA